MPTLMQKIRLAFRGWQRRREESEKEFLTRNASWSAAAPAAAAAPAKTRAFAIDMEGLTVAYLDDSGQLAHFLDTSDGEIIDVRIYESSTYAPPRYRRIPARDANADAEDRRAFIAALDESPSRDALARSSDADSFRRALSADRTLERAWYNFRNDRAIAVIEQFLAADDADQHR